MAAEEWRDVMCAAAINTGERAERNGGDGGRVGAVVGRGEQGRRDPWPARALGDDAEDSLLAVVRGWGRGQADGGCQRCVDAVTAVGVDG